ncbi:MAG: 30S ribosome-binding factor RbfA [Nitrospiraceae bacterium]
MKPVTKRATRVADQIRMEVADILMRKVRDPRLRAVTVTEVSVTNDLRLARVYFTAGLDGASDRDLAAGLSKAAGFIRSELGQRLELRYTPELVFFKDISGPRGDRVLALLDDVRLGRDGLSTPTNESSESSTPEAAAAAWEDGENKGTHHAR